MAELIRELDARLKGSLQETEDWWRLMRGAGGALYVHHKWSHTKLKTLATDEGERKVAVEQFLAEDHPWASGARDALRAYLEEVKSANA